jgi:regulator of sigma E protease
MEFLISVLAVVIAFGLVIFVHEFGHFIVAKKSGVKVDRFSFGLGPELIGFTWGETRYCIARYPLGGEVRMAGEMAFEEDGPVVRKPGDYFALSWYRRLPIVLAGPAMNYVLAFFLFSFVFFFWGNPRSSTEPVIGDLVAGYPAQQAGLTAGDRFLAANGTSVYTWDEVASAMHASPEKAVLLDVRGRDGVNRTLTVVPRRDSRGVGLIGISPETLYDRMGFFDSFRRGAEQTVHWTVYTLRYLGEKIITRQKPELAGPVGIASVISKAAHSGPQDFLFLIAMISLGIGLFNLFPIPLLDGGHAVFYLWEGISRRPLNKKLFQAANVVGLSFLLAILVFSTYSDVLRLRPGKKPPTAAAPAETESR